jgi:zinc protease
MRSLNLLFVASSAAALLAGCAYGPLEPEHAYAQAVAAGLARPADPAPLPPAAPQREIEPRTWAHTRSDRKPDPGARFGALPNGMRYVLMKNATPKGEASVRLRVGAGSLHEADDQQGLAHFLEHMVLNETKSFKEGELIKQLERQGMAFGADTNAYTSFDETVFMLELPETDDETVDLALKVMREVAADATLDSGAIDRERGIVLSEERTRDGPGYRTLKDYFRFAFKDQRLASRFPIGTTEVIRSAGRERFQAFYDAYYRPENAQLVVVGDFDVDAMETKIRAQFSDWRGRGVPGAAPALGKVAERGQETHVFVEPGGSTAVQLNWLSPPEMNADTREREKRLIVERLGLAVLNRRLGRLARGANPPFIAASGGASTLFDTADITTLQATVAGSKWREALSALEQEQRRIAVHGITEPELQREIAESRAFQTTSVASAATRSSPGLARHIVGSINQDYVFVHPSDSLALFEETVKDLKAETVSSTLKALFTGEGPLVHLATTEPVQGGAAAVTQALAASSQVAVAPGGVTTAKAWPFTNFGPVGRVAERREETDLQTTLVRFENGVRLTVKPTKLKDDEILVSARFGDGRLDQARDRWNAAWAAGFSFTEGGLESLTKEDIEEVLASKVVGSSLSVGEDAFSLSGSTRPEDFAIQMQVLAAYATRPGWRGEGWERMRSFANTLHSQYEATPGGVLGRDLDALLRSGDRRWSTPSQAEITAGELGDMKALLEGPLRSGPIEVVVVGDVTVDQAIAQTAATFGALPPRGPESVAPAQRRVVFPSPPASPVRRTHKGRADQAVALIAWPTTDFPSDPKRARTLSLMQKVIELRLIDELREGQAVTYSPQSWTETAWEYPGYGYLAALIEAPPEKLDGFFADAVKIARQLRETPVTADELLRARRPTLEAYQKAQAGNGYWMTALSGAGDDPRRLAAVRTFKADIERVTAADIQAAARQYLVETKAWRMVVAPEVKTAAAAN